MRQRTRRRFRRRFPKDGWCLTVLRGYLPFGRYMQSKTLDAREAVLASAVNAFARRGYAGTSVQDILRATGLSKPTIYYYFKSKAGLFRAILAFAYDESY